MAEIEPGTLIDDRYRVLSRLGSGGMADVFCAEDQQLGRKVALKLLHRRFAEDPGFVERFRREAQAAAALQHPNVVSVYDRGTYGDTYYIAMEYLPGRTLKRLIRDEAPLDPVRAIDITLQILRAARFAHRRGVIHRDLKPHNVIVDESDHAKVTDFGIARAGASDMTETGSIMGTAQYLSPEQAQGHAVSATSDLYSIAVVLYELLTGRVPFDAEAAVTIALKHVSEAPLPPTAVNRNVPPELEQVVLWALEKDPMRRPADADQLIGALESAREAIVSGARGQRTASMAAVAVGGSGAAAPPGPPPTHLTPSDPPPVVTPPPVGGEWEGAGTQPPLPPDGQPHRRRRRWPWVLLFLALIAGGATAAILLTRPNQKVVPNVVTQPLSTAETVLTNAGFTPNVLNVPDNHAAGTVISQSPAGGTKADEGSTVNIKVSQGPGNVPVPSVAGLTLKGARAAITAANLKPGRVVLEPSNSIAADKVTRTEPPAGQPEPVGTTVTIFVSSGPQAIAVPNVVGQSKDAATTLLESRGFSVNAANQPSSSTANTVIAQNPPADTRAAQGSTVTITVATPQTAPMVTVPNEVNQDATAAASALRAAGFLVVQRQRTVTNPIRDGIVLTQSPAGGTLKTKGSTVTIVVGHFKAKPPPTTTTTTTTTSHSTT
jgi:serine/threonine protein kinase